MSRVPVKMASLISGSFTKLSGPLAFRLTLALVLLISPAVAKPHPTPAADSAASLKELQLATGESGDLLAAAICHHGDTYGSGEPRRDDDGSLPCKNICPVCQALQHSSPGIVQSQTCAPAIFLTRQAALFPNSESQVSRLFDPGGAYPRAPPAA
ncbi:MAG TPA: hypothetical protein VE986_03655 [Hyphomicrobiales bacterium]|nr:hypothetical protein [Hyphomicrobiales bacterium]